MEITIAPSKLKGTVAVPPSKSMAHRLLILAAFADQPTHIIGVGGADDLLATKDALSALGAGIEECEDGVVVTPVQRGRQEAAGTAEAERAFDCGESGSTLRFMLPLTGLDGVHTLIRVHGRLAERPNAAFISELSRKGLEIEQNGQEFSAEGMLTDGVYRLPGNVSSQYISALLMALPLIGEESFLEIDGEWSSAGYIDMTLSAMRLFGVEPLRNENGFVVVHAGSYCSPGEVRVEGDWSAASFFAAANALGSEVGIEGVDQNSWQPDRCAGELLGRILAGNARIDIDGCPDLLPPLAVAACAAAGKTTFFNAGRLRAKESDRLTSTASLITALGGKCCEEDEMLVIEGTGGQLRGGVADSFGDHRIAMSAAVAALICKENVRVKGAESVAKSYPSFWEDYKMLGGRIVE